MAFIPAKQSQHSSLGKLFACRYDPLSHKMIPVSLCRTAKRQIRWIEIQKEEDIRVRSHEEIRRLLLQHGFLLIVGYDFKTITCDCKVDLDDYWTVQQLATDDPTEIVGYVQFYPIGI